MLAYILRRIGLMIPTLLGIMLITFTIVQFAPGFMLTGWWLTRRRPDFSTSKHSTIRKLCNHRCQASCCQRELDAR